MVPIVDDVGEVEAAVELDRQQHDQDTNSTFAAVLEVVGDGHMDFAAVLMGFDRQKKKGQQREDWEGVVGSCLRPMRSQQRSRQKRNGQGQSCTVCHICASPAKDRMSAGSGRTG